MSQKLVESAWRGFEKRTIPAQAGPEQRLSLKMAFYGGAATLLDILTNIISPGSEPTRRDLDIMKGVDQELKDFAQEMAKFGAPKYDS